MWQCSGCVCRWQGVVCRKRTAIKRSVWRSVLFFITSNSARSTAPLLSASAAVNICASALPPSASSCAMRSNSSRSTVPSLSLSTASANTRAKRGGDKLSFGAFGGAAPTVVSGAAATSAPLRFGAPAPLELSSMPRRRRRRRIRGMCYSRRTKR